MPHDQAAAPGSGLAVRRLTATDFRNYSWARLSVDRRPVVLTGPNGAGKTNLLEALSFLAPGRGLRRAALGEASRRAGDEAAAGWAVAARLDTADGPVEIGTGIAPAARPGAGARRIVRVDGADAASQSALARWVALSWVTPEMDRLFDGPSADRRRFLDRLVYGFDREHSARLNRYERALRERARLLRGEGMRADGAWLEALESTMAEAGVAVAAARRGLTRRLDAVCRAAAGPFPAASVAVEGAVEAMLDEAPALAVEDAARARLARLRPVDIEAGGARFGPHRSDLVCVHLAKDRPAGACSTGEQKALLIRIVLGHARLAADERGAAPLLLLDEVAAHLDAERRGALFEEILALGSQAWMTGTEPGPFDGLGARVQHFGIRDGVLAPLALSS